MSRERLKDIFKRDNTWRKTMPTQQRRTYRGCDFELWNNQQAWFWMRADHNAVGATSSESEAIAEVCAAIDQSLGPFHDRTRGAHFTASPSGFSTIAIGFI
jgi:hypothetical protein